MKKHLTLIALFLMIGSCPLCIGQDKTETSTSNTDSESEAVLTPRGLITITRGVGQDSNGAMNTVLIEQYK